MKQFKNLPRGLSYFFLVVLVSAFFLGANRQRLDSSFELHEFAIPSVDTTAHSGDGVRSKESIIRERSFQNATVFFPRLQVPFYVYENGLNWENATILGQPVATVIYPGTSPLIHFKHLSDYWMLQAALRHPMRTRDPSQAKLFFVPTLMNVLFEMYHSKSRVGMGMNLCVDGMCGMANLMKSANQLLNESEWFQKSGGYDHILVSCHSDSNAAYTKTKAFYKSQHRDNLWETSKIIFEDRFRPPFMDDAQDYRRHQPHHLPHLYVSHGCPHNDSTPKMQDFAMIASLHHDQRSPQVKARFQPRRDLCQWLTTTTTMMDKNSTTTTTTNRYSVALCGEGAQCPALGHARYGFHVKGDTLGANRLQDTILSGTVPIFTDPRQYDILPNFIPWRDFSELVPLLTSSSSSSSSSHEFHESLDAILHRPPQVYEAKLQLLLQYQPVVDLVHSSHFTFDWYMAEFAKRMGLY
jgi:hypothetical protein